MTLPAWLHDLLQGLGLVAGGGVLGRLMYHAREVQAGRRPPFGWHLFWELPVAIGMGAVGKGIAAWLQLGGWSELALVVCVAYLGPPLIGSAFVIARRRVSGDCN